MALFCGLLHSHVAGVTALKLELSLQVLLKVPGMQDLVEALSSYTQRHFVRMDRLVRSSFLLDYTLASMNVLMPEVEADAVAANDLDEPEKLVTDVDESTGTDVDMDAFMQPAADVQADADIQAVLSEQQMEPVDAAAPEQEGQLQDEVKDDDQQLPQHDAHTAKKALSKRRESAPQASLGTPAAAQNGSQTSVKAKRKRVK